MKKTALNGYRKKIYFIVYRMSPIAFWAMSAGRAAAKCIRQPKGGATLGSMENITKPVVREVALNRITHVGLRGNVISSDKRELLLAEYG